MGKLLPSETNDLGESAVVCLNTACYTLAFDEGRAEKDKGIGRAGDMIWRFFPRGSRGALGTKTG